MFTKFVNKKVQDTLHAKERAFSRKKHGHYTGNLSANSYRDIDLLIDGEGGDDYIHASRFVNGTLKGGLGNDDINASTYNYYWYWQNALDLNGNSILDKTIVASIDGGDGDDKISLRGDNTYTQYGDKTKVDVKYDNDFYEIL